MSVVFAWHSVPLGQCGIVEVMCFVNHEVDICVCSTSVWFTLSLGFWKAFDETVDGEVL